MARDIARQLDPVLFARDCGIEPDPWQADILRKRPHRAHLNASRQSGKTTTTALVALHTALYVPDAPVVVVSPSQRQSAELLRTVYSLYGNLEGAPSLNTESVLKAEFPNGSRIIALPGTERTIRGIGGASLVIVDEASRCDQSLFSACKPMLAVSNGALILLSTPAGRRGFFFEISQNGDSAWHRVIIPASECPRISKQFLDEQLRELGPTRFAEEFECRYVDQEDSAFSTAIIDGIVSQELVSIW